MIARDKKTHKTVFTSLQGPEEVIKELLGSTVTNDHGIMQRLLPVTWTDTNVRPCRTAPGLRRLLQGQLEETLKFEIFSENRQIDAGGDDKL